MRTSLTIIVSAAILFLCGCAALEEITPVSQAEADRMAVAQSKDVDSAIRGVEQGDPLDAILGGGGALLATILLSRFRRRTQLAKATLEKKAPSA